MTCQLNIFKVIPFEFHILFTTLSLRRLDNYHGSSSNINIGFWGCLTCKTIKEIMAEIGPIGFGLVLHGTSQGCQANLTH